MSTRKQTYGIRDLEKKYGELSLGRFLSSWRKSEGLTQREFALRLGISPANLCDIERGRKGVGILKATEIAKEIGYSPTALVQLALQELVSASGLDYRVEVTSKVA